MLDLGFTTRLVLATTPLAIWAGTLLAVLLLGVVASPPADRRRRLDALLHWTMALALCLVWYVAVTMLTGGHIGLLDT